MLSPERTYRQITRTAALAGFVLNLILVNPAAAQSNDSTNIGHSDKRPRFHISVEGVYAMLETNIRFESQNSILGAKINLEESLGFDKSRIMPMFMATFNIKNRHSLLGIVYSLPRDSYIKTEREFEYNGNIIEVGTEINSYYNTNVFSVGYMYDVVRDSKANLGLFVNFYIMTLSSGIQTAGGLIDENFKVTAPLPNFGAMAQYKLSKRIGLSGFFSIFFLTVGDFSGAIHNIGGELDFYLTPWLDLGLGYYLLDLNIEAETSQFVGIFDFIYQGPYLSLGFGF